jgi:hypothetical protein
MLGIIRNFIRKFLPNLYADSLRNTPETNPFFPMIGGQETDPVNAPGSIESKHFDRLGYIEGEGKVPDDFNTMGASEIESMFYDNK